jgi:hypothetical protein
MLSLAYFSCGISLSPDGFGGVECPFTVAMAHLNITMTEQWVSIKLFIGKKHNLHDLEQIKNKSPSSNVFCSISNPILISSAEGAEGADQPNYGPFGRACMTVT